MVGLWSFLCCSIETESCLFHSLCCAAENVTCLLSSWNLSCWSESEEYVLRVDLNKAKTILILWQVVKNELPCVVPPQIDLLTLQQTVKILLPWFSLSLIFNTSLPFYQCCIFYWNTLVPLTDTYSDCIKVN